VILPRHVMPGQDPGICLQLSSVIPALGAGIHALGREAKSGQRELSLLLDDLPQLSGDRRRLARDLLLAQLENLRVLPGVRAQ